MDKGIQKCKIHTQEYYSAIKKKEILPSAVIRTDFEGVTLVK